MHFMFATCDRRMALGFLKRIYPSRTVEDTAADAGPLLDLVEADIVRIPDPYYHAAAVQPGKKWDEARRDEIVEVCRRFHEGKS